MPLRERTRGERLVLVWLLPCVAGMVNGAGLLQLGITSSHMTGNVTRAGVDLVHGLPGEAGALALLIGGFLLGALVAAGLVDGGLNPSRSRYAVAFLLESLLLALHSWLQLHPRLFPGPLGLGMLLCAAMGLQNALVTRLSGAVVRTTHLTGILTDVAIETVRLVRYVGAHLRGNEAERVRLEGDVVKLRLHLSLFLAFGVGALLIPVWVDRLQALWTALPVALLLALAGVDLVRGIAAPGAPAPPA